MEILRKEDVRVGDYVMICPNCSRKDAYVSRIESGNEIDIYCEAPGLIQPIEITDKILEANGFTLKGNTGHEEWTCRHGKFIVSAEKHFNDWHVGIFLRGTSYIKIMINIQFVHELQHILHDVFCSKSIEMGILL